MDFRQIPEDDKVRYLAEIRLIAVAAREAKEKTPRFALLLIDRHPNEMENIVLLISTVSYELARRITWLKLG